MAISRASPCMPSSIGEHGRGQEHQPADSQPHHRGERQGAVGRAVGFLELAGPPMAGHDGRRPDADQAKHHPAEPVDVGRQPDGVRGRRADLAREPGVVEADEKREQLFQQRRQREREHRRVHAPRDDALRRRRRGRGFRN